MARSALVPVALLASVVIAWCSQQPPSPLGADAPAAGFSAGRALVHVQRLTARPRPIGSKGHADAKAYLETQLAALGVSMRTRSLIAQQGNGLARIHNIIGTIEGRGSSGQLTIGIMGHYDSVASSPGAGDNAAGVAAMLETIRALKAGPPLRNTIAFVFTDGEEAGLFGAQAIDAGGYDVMLNFDARGSRGVSLLFETGTGNAEVVRHFAQLARPVGSSAYVEAYRRMPNDSDFSYFRDAPGGLNFVFLDGFLDYHSDQDDVAHLSLGTLQHHGDNMLQLARSLGNATAAPRSDDDLVFFDVLGRIVVRYPTGWALAFAIALVLAVVAMVYAARRWRSLSLAGAAKGAVLLVVCSVVGSLVADFGWKALRVADAPHRLPQGHAYDEGLVLTALGALIAAAVSALSLPWRSNRGPAELLLGAAVVFAVAGVPAAWIWQGASYLLATPALLTLIAGGLACAHQDRRWAWWAPALVALVAVIYVPTALLLSTALTFRVVESTGAVLGLLAGLMVPHLPAPRRGWIMPAGFAAVGVALLVGSAITSELDRHERRANSLVYVWDQDASQGTYVSTDPAPDEWTRQFLGASPPRAPFPDLFPGARSRVLTAPAPRHPTQQVTFQLAAPTGDRQAIEVSIGDDVALVNVRGAGETRLADVDGKFVEYVRHVRYWAPAPTFTVNASNKSGPARIMVDVVRYGLPAELSPPRPPHLMQQPVGFGLPDLTVVRAATP